MTIFLRFAAVERLYECTVSESCSFHQILETMKPMIRMDLEGNLNPHEKMVVFACWNHAECDPDVSLRSLGIVNGMEFLVI